MNRFRLFPAILAFSILLTACGEEAVVPEAETAIPVTTWTVEPGLRDSFTVTGEVQAEQSAQITSQFTADVVEIHVQPGDIVRKGTVLVSLDADSVEARYANSTLTYSTAYQNLQQTQVTSQTTVEQANIAYEQAQSDQRSVNQQNAARRIQAEEQRKGVSVSRDLSVQSATIALESTVTPVRNTVDTALSAVNSLLEYSPQYQDFHEIQETHIGVKDPTQKGRTEFSLIDSLNAFDRYADDEASAMTLLPQVEQTLVLALQMLRNSVTSTGYPQSSLDGKIAAITSHLSTIRSQLSSIRSAKAALDSAKQQIGTIPQQLAQAEAAYQATIAELDRSDEQAARNVESARIALESAKASASISQIGARSNLAAVAGELSQARIEQGKLRIVAPFDGTVVAIPVRTGEEVRAGNMIVSLENAGSLKIVASLSSDEIDAVRAGQEVTIDERVQAPIVAVAPSADPVTKKYQVEIRSHSGSALKPGQFVRVQFSPVIDASDQRIFAPLMAVHVNANETYVWRLGRSGSTLTNIRQPVVIGEIAGSSVEIVSGLTRGQRVITGGSRSITEEGITVTAEDNNG